MDQESGGAAPAGGAAPGAEPRIAAKALRAGRGGVAATPALDFTLRPGGALLVTGPNGAGKSTLLRTLAGLLPPVAGDVRPDGFVAPDGEPATRLREVAHYLGHRNALKSASSVSNTLGFWRRFAGAPHLDVEAALEAVGLGNLGHLPAGALSAGQARRAALARLLVSHRPVWILDEPTASLDGASQARVAALLGAHREAGGIVIAATHLPLDLDGATTLVLADPATPGEGRAAVSGLDEDEALRAEGWL